MKIYSCNSVSFKRRLKPSEESGYIKTLEEGKKAVGNTGMSMLIVPQQSLPQTSGKNTGVGNLLSKDGQEFIDFAKKYWGINTVQILPVGEKFSRGGAYFPYSGSAFSLSVHNIDFEKLTENEYGNILEYADLENIVRSNNIANKESWVNYENVYDKNSSTDRALRQAYQNLIKGDTSQKQKLLSEFEDYKLQNKEWLEPLSVYKGLMEEHGSSNYTHWGQFDANLYNDTLIPLEKRAERIAEIKTKHSLTMDLYNFEQFIAEKHLKSAKEILNKKGIELSGDMLSGFSADEVWANPKAFIKTRTIGCGITALDFEKEEGKEVLRKKVKRFAELYDGIRVDYAWSYCNQPLYDKGNTLAQTKFYKGELLDIIEDEFRKTKGNKFKPENITYEFIANRELFDPFENGKLKPYIENRNKIYCSNYMSNDWVTTDAFKRLDWKDGSYILGATNHDCRAMKIDYQNETKKLQEADILSRILKIPKEKLKNLNEFINAKFAEPLSSKHNMFFYLDALNLDGLYKDNADKTMDYRIKIPANYQDNYFKSLEKYAGYNPMDALEKQFVAQGLDKSNPKLYEKIVKYKEILQSKKTIGKYGIASIICGVIIAGILLGIAGAHILTKNSDAKIKEKI